MARLETLSSDQGLSQGMIYDILQDKTGFLWFATRDGLNRYNGYSFEVFKSNPFNPYSISDNIIKILFQDRKGRIWVGTETNGVDIYDPVSGRFYHLSKGSKGLHSQNINAFAETPDGAMWVATYKGLSRVILPDVLPDNNPDLSTVAVSEHFAWENDDDAYVRPNIVISLLASDDGNLWVGTARDAYRFNTTTKNVELIPVAENVVQFGNMKANYFTKGPEGSIWLAQFNRMIEFKDGRTNTFDFQALGNLYTTSLTFDLNGNLFVSRRKEILFYSKEDLQAIRNGSGPSSASRRFCTFPEKGVIGSTMVRCDRRGLIWIGTNGYGIRKYNPVNRLFRHYMAGVSTRKIRSNNAGEVWVWTTPGVFCLVDEKTGQVQTPLFPDSRIFQHDCVFAADDKLWIFGQVKGGTDDNSVLIGKNLKTGAEERYTNLLTAGMYSQIMEDREGNLWLLGNKSDLVKFNPAGKTHELFDLSAFTGFKEYAFALIEDANGDIWVGTPHGLVRGKKGGDKKMDFSLHKNDPANTNSLNNNAILSFCDDQRDPQHFLWVGTRGGGLNLLNKTNGQCRHYTPADGLPNDVIYGIVYDSSRYLWLSSNSGLSKFNPDNDHFENYSVADGLQDNEFNTVSYAQKNNGQLIFGGVNGLTVFDPKGINIDNFSPPVLITVLKVENKITGPGEGILVRTIEQTTSITLDHDQNDITLEFAALDFSTPQKNQYRYRLLGANDKWSPATTEHITTFSNLAPGHYTFEVVTGGAHGVWGDVPTQLNIIVLPPWWKSNLAYFLYFLLISGAAWLIYKRQIRRIQLQEQLAYEHREAERIRAIEQMKTNFFSNITHELRTPLTLVLEPLRQLLHKPATENWLPKVRLAENNSRKLLQIVNQLLDLAKLEGNAMRAEYRREQVAEILIPSAESFADKARGKNIDLCYGAKDAAIEPFDLDSDKLATIATNLLSNALKFTPSGGTVDMNWRTAPGGWFVLEVRDSGEGIAAEDLPKVFERFFSKTKTFLSEQSSTGIGLALCRELAELMGGRMEVESSEGSGSTFRLLLPMQHRQPNELRTSEAFTNISLPPENREERDAILPPPVESGTDRPLLLLAEDNQELRHFIAQTLSEKYEIVQAADGQEATEIAFEQTPDIVISDYMMPRLDGIGLLDALKSDVRTSHIPVLMLSAKIELESRIKGLKHGADAYLGKPFQTEELFAWLENLLESRKRLQEMFGKNLLTNQRSTDLSTDQPSAGLSSAQEAMIGVLDRQFLDRFREIMEAEIENEAVTTEDIARQMAMSRSQLHRKLSALSGLSATEYLRNYRLDRALELLQAGAGNVSEIAFRVGFVNAKHFSTSFKERFGKSPSKV